MQYYIDCSAHHIQRLFDQLLIDRITVFLVLNTHAFAVVHSFGQLARFFAEAGYALEYLVAVRKAAIKRIDNLDYGVEGRYTLTFGALYHIPIIAILLARKLK